MNGSMIIVSQDKDMVFYHVRNDMMRYLDLTSIKRNYPELQEYIRLNYFSLQREFFRIKENLE